CESSARSGAAPEKRDRYSPGTARPPCSQVTTTARPASARVVAPGSRMEPAPVGERVAERTVDAEKIAPRGQDRAERPPDTRRQRAGAQVLLQEALVDARQRSVRRRAVDQMLPQLGEGRARLLEAERLEVLPLADLRAFAVARRQLEQPRELLRVPAPDRSEARAALFAQAPQRADDRDRKSVV